MSSSSSWDRKRKYRRNISNRIDSFKRPRFDDRFPIINKVQSQKGIRGQIVIFQSNLDMPYTVLQNAVDRINGIISVKTVENKRGYYRLIVNNETLAEAPYESLGEAKRGLAELSLINLRKSCFTIFRKVHPRNSQKVDLLSPSTSTTTAGNVTDNSSSSRSLAPPMNLPKAGGIGARMMLQMGWLGGGLGAKEQGRTTIVQPYLQIQRQGLGTKNIVQEVTKVLQDYASSRDINSIAFSPDFTKEERIVIHEVARKLNLKSRSYGHDSDRVLVIQSKVRPWDLIYSLLESGGESEQLRLIQPTNFDPHL